MSVLQAITQLIGTIPAGYEAVAWVVSGVILLYLTNFAFSIFINIFKIFIKER